MREITLADLQVISQHFPLDDCLPPPELAISPEAAQAFDRLFDEAAASGPGAVIDYTLPYPKYLFLEHLAAARGLMLHGSNTRAIQTLNPIRQSSDSSEFGRQEAIYATPDPFWALFFAVLDKNGLSGTSNAALHLRDAAGALTRRYYFTLDVDHLRRGPWTSGAMYILPAAGFEPDPSMLNASAGPYMLEVTHWIYRGALQPLASLNVEPADFPFLGQIWGYDAQAFARRMDEPSLAGFPFLRDEEIYPVRPGKYKVY